MRTTSGIAALVAGAVVLGSASGAWALDAWRDRRGMFYGATLGFGGSKAEKGERLIGFNARGRVGGGVAKRLTLDAELGLDHIFEEDANTNLMTAFLGGNFFLLDSLYLRAMGGVSHLSPEEGDSETGLAVGGGLGYEFFANSDLAIGALADFQQHFFDKFDLNVFSIGVTITHY